MTSRGAEKMNSSTIGIDILKDTLDAYRMEDGASRRFANDKTGHRALIAWIGGEASFRADCRHDVIDVHVVREPPFGPQGIVHDARLILDAQPGGAQRLGDLLRRDELAPVMRAPREPTQ
jgi:hypothetical protein